MKRTVIILAVIALLVGAFALGHRTGRKGADEAVKIQTDTLIVYDTLRVSTPVEIAHTIVREKEVEVPVYIHTTDTVIQTVFVPREERIYKDSTYFAVVSGVDPRLDHLEVYSKELVTTIERETKVKPRWSIGVQGGYGIGKAGLTPYIGIGLQYNIISFGRRNF